MDAICVACCSFVYIYTCHSQYYSHVTNFFANEMKISFERNKCCILEYTSCSKTITLTLTGTNSKIKYVIKNNEYKCYKFNRCSQAVEGTYFCGF